MGGQLFKGTTFEISELGTIFTKIGDITGYNFEDGETSDIDTTHSESLKKEYINGLAEADTVTYDVNFEIGGAGLALAKACKAAGTAYFFKVTYSNAKVHTFQGQVKSVPHSGSNDDILKGSVGVRLTTDVAEA